MPIGIAKPGIVYTITLRRMPDSTLCTMGTSTTISNLTGTIWLRSSPSGVGNPAIVATGGISSRPENLCGLAYGLQVLALPSHSRRLPNHLFGYVPPGPLDEYAPPLPSYLALALAPELPCCCK